MYLWSRNSTQVLFVGDRNGREDWHIYAIDVASRMQRDLTPIEGINAVIIGLSDRSPDAILVGIMIVIERTTTYGIWIFVRLRERSSTRTERTLTRLLLMII